MWVALITHSRIISNQQYIPCSLYQTCLVCDTGDATLAMCVEPFPTKNQGLVSLELEEKRHYVESFRVLLSSWPEFPMELQDLLMPLAVSTHVWVVEKNLARFYTQAFFDNFSRPPIVPHLIAKPHPDVYAIGGR